MAEQKTAYHHGDLPRALKSAALDLISEHGVTGFTLREAARRAGVTHAAPYRHFSDKSALLAALAEDGFSELRRRLEEAADQAGDDPLARFVSLAPAYVRFAVEQPSYFRVMYGFDAPDKMKYERLGEADDAAFAVLVEGVRMAQEKAAFIHGDTQRIAILAWLMVHGLAHAHIDGALTRRGIDADNIDEALAQGSELMMRGFLAGSG